MTWKTSPRAPRPMDNGSGMTAIDATLTAAHDAAWHDRAMLEFLTANAVRAFKAQRHGDHARFVRRSSEIRGRVPLPRGYGQREREEIQAAYQADCDDAVRNREPWERTT